MNEAFLHFVWKYRLYNPLIKNTLGQQIEVLHTGIHNHDAGPDFSNARIKIDDTTWAGNVEIHMKSSDWLAHKHQFDPAYGNVILHVVFDHDRVVDDLQGTPLITVELKGHIHEGVYKKYFYFINNQLWIPCEKDLHQINVITLKSWLERLFIERMERKLEVIHTLFKHNKNDLSETFYQWLAGNFGFKTNEQPFQILARLLPAGILAKHKSSRFQIEALMFGCAGMLNDDFRDGFPNELQQEFRFLQKKYSLATMEAHLWKFLRLRPVNFPTIRISQFAALVHKSDNLLSKIMETNSLSELRAFFAVKASNYWDDHYHFDKPSAKRDKTLGKSSVDILILNSVVQFLFLYSKIKGNPVYRDRAIDFMLELNPESNHIIKKWDEIGIESTNALETQALLELKNNYCKPKQCLSCSIGTKLLRQSSV